MSDLDWKQRLRIVLVGSETSGNVGAAARALKTMGLSRLVLVDPECDPLGPEALALAHNAHDVLTSAVVVPTLAEALAGTVRSIATTQRSRRQGAPFLSPDQAAAEIRDFASTGDVALVFGRESRGLTNEELALCTIYSTVPAAVETPSLNLAQAVMVYCYVLHQQTLAPVDREYAWNLVPHEALEQFFARLEDALHAQGVTPATTMTNYVARFRRILARVPLEPRDLNLFYNLLLGSRGPGRPELSQDDSE
jgi:tRNA/rRNA methyltransferase